MNPTDIPNIPSPDRLFVELLEKAEAAFGGIQHVNTAGRREKLATACSRFKRQSRIPLSAATLGTLADRIIELRAAWAAAESALDEAEAIALKHAKELSTEIEARDKRIAELEGALLEREGGWGGSEVDTGRPKLASGTLRDPLSPILRRLDALEAKERGETPDPPSTPAGTLSDD